MVTARREGMEAHRDRARVLLAAIPDNIAYVTARGLRHSTSPAHPADRDVTAPARGSLQIQNAKERRLVALADALLSPLAWLRGPRPRPAARRILLMRLERIGDLLMVLEAIHDARTAWPEAEIDLAVGAWNLPAASMVRAVDGIQTATVPWLSRDDRHDSWSSLLAIARRWRARRYDVAINFEPDIRSNALAWLSGAPVRVGYWTGGGGALLTDAAAYDAAEHVSANARALVARAVRASGGAHATPVGSSRAALLTVPAEAAAAAEALLGAAARPLIGVHASGGRESKQWHLDRFGQTARRLAEQHGGTIVLTGADADRTLVDVVKRELDGVPVVDASGALELPALAALLSRLDLFVTGDTGPMHLAGVVGTPIVALFGPSEPRRYGPPPATSRVLRVQLSCSPCGMVRLPPERCRGHVPDCMDGITVDAVVAAAADLLGSARGRRA